MGRKKIHDKQYLMIFKTLCHYGVDKEFAEQVSNTYIKKGPGFAIIQLYAGGWEICKYYYKGEAVFSINRILSKCITCKTNGR